MWNLHHWCAIDARMWQMWSVDPRPLRLEPTKMICGERKLGPDLQENVGKLIRFPMRRQSKHQTLPMGRIWNPLHGSSNQDHSLFGLLDFQLYHAEVDITFFLSTLPIISTNPCWTVERSPKQVRFLHSKGWISIAFFTHGALNAELWKIFEGKKWLSRKPDVVNILKISPPIIIRNDVSNEKNQERFGRLLQPGYGKSTRTSVSSLEETLGMDHCRSSILGEKNRSPKKGVVTGYLGVGWLG